MKKRVLAFEEWVWHETSVPVFLERFILTVLAAAFMACVALNTMNFDIPQRVSLGIALVAFAYFVGHTLHEKNTSKEAIAPPIASEAPITKPSGVLIGVTDLKVVEIPAAAPKIEIHIHNYSKTDPATLLPPTAEIEGMHAGANKDSGSYQIMPDQKSWYTLGISSDKEAEPWLKARFEEIRKGTREVHITLRYQAQDRRIFSKRYSGRFVSDSFSVMNVGEEIELKVK